MWEQIGSSLLSAGMKLFGMNKDEDIAEKNLALQRESMERNIALQKQFAQEGLRWKVEDAKAAGVHPLYALGASGTSFSPVSIGNLPEGKYTEAYSGMGQDLSRAINATRTQGERADAFTLSAQKLDLEGKQLDNDIKRATLASSVQRLKQSANPPMPGSVPGLVPNKGEFEDSSRLMLPNGEWLVNPAMSSAQDFENTYGEVSDWTFGPAKLWNDYLYNYPRVEGFIEGMMRPRTFNERFGHWRMRKKE